MKHLIVRTPEGNMSLTRFVMTHVKPGELSDIEARYPHVFIDTQAKFNRFCQKHNLDRRRYKMKYI